MTKHVDITGDETPDHPLDSFFPSPVNRRGRKKSVLDTALSGTRNRLVGLLETTWCDVGFGLQRIREGNITDIKKAKRILQPTLRVWEEHRDCAAIDLLLRTTHAETDTRALRRMQVRLYELKNNVPGLVERQTRSLEALRDIKHFIAAIESLQNQSERAQHPPEPSPDQLEEIRNEQKTRELALGLAEEEYAALRTQVSSLETSLKDGYAYAAWSELLDFCTDKDKRYALTPLNLACALAGVPFLKWRHSLVRCLKWEIEDFGRGPYATFRTICLIVNSCPPKGKLLPHAEKWLREKRRTESSACAGSA